MQKVCIEQCAIDFCMIAGQKKIGCIEPADIFSAGCVTFNKMIQRDDFCHELVVFDVVVSSGSDRVQHNVRVGTHGLDGLDHFHDTCENGFGSAFVAKKIARADIDPPLRWLERGR